MRNYGHKLNESFRKFATSVSDIVGSSLAFVLAITSVATWLILGKYFNFSDTWQLTYNTMVTIITFLMVFIIQNTQNRSSKVVQLKLDELLRGTSGPRTELVTLEEFTDEELEQLREEFMIFI
jgi:low affinity Fe/Cu permease